ncbi:MAG: FxsA family protein [Chitinispirillaceae bacterium]|nr:FxsA family protein [Chitinispirillaceae bacterium]
MFIRLVLLFTLLPLAELFILLKVGAAIGLLNTIILVIGTATLGAYLAKRQGLETLNRIRQQLENGALPAEELIDGLLILIAAVVLITPGLLTDTFGFLLLIPQTRRWLKRYVKELFNNRISRGSMWVYRR